MATISRKQYASLYGPTKGDKVRLGDTSLLAEVEHDHTVYGEECWTGAGRVMRDGMAYDAHTSRADGAIDVPVCNAALEQLDVDEAGFDRMDRRLLLSLIDKFDGGPVGLDTLAATIGEEKQTVEDVYEPYLVQQGYVVRSRQGRVATRMAYAHLGLKPPPGRTGELF